MRVINKGSLKPVGNTHLLSLLQPYPYNRTADVIQALDVARNAGKLTHMCV